MPEWTLEQRRAIETLDRPYALIAGAGSGKTTVLVERYRRLLARGLRPHQILTVTFTQDAAAQLKERITARLEAEEQDHARLIREVETTSSIGTIHAFCYGVLDQFGALAGLAPVQSVVDPFLAAVAFDREYDRWAESLPTESFHKLLTRFSRTELRRVARQLWGAHREGEVVLGEEAREVRDLCLPLWQKLDESLLSHGLYTFADLETLTGKILREVPEVAEKLEERIHAMLVDEFQDTSPLQWSILRAAVGGDLGRIFVVGDPKQSIYGFRQADVRVFLETAKEFERAGGEIGELTQNFRSRSQLLTSLNTLARPLFAASDIPFSPMLAGRTDDGLAMESTRLLRHESTDLEPKTVAAAVRELVDAGESPQEIALLFRVSDRIPRFRAALNDLGISAELRQTQALFESYDVLDLAHGLEALADPLNDFAVMAFLRSSYVRLTLAELYALQKRVEPTFFEKLKASGVAADWVALLESPPATVGAALSAIFRLSGKMPNRSEAVLGFVAALLPDTTPLFEAVERVRRWRREDLRVSSGSETGGVRLMTVHGAKGLEFRHVFLVDTLRFGPRASPAARLGAGGVFGLRWKVQGEFVEDEIYAGLSETAKAREREESQRILYVALTRARESLTLSLPKPEAKFPKDTWGDWLQKTLSEGVLPSAPGEETEILPVPPPPKRSRKKPELQKPV